MNFMKITITAFEPFGGFNTNSSYVALSKLSNLAIDKIVLPVSYPDAYVTLKETIKETNFIILLGMAAKREKVSIEVRAKNLLDFRIPDNNQQIITKRKDAIKEALRVAKEGDVILLIGKGHEMYEEIEGVKYPFDERQVVIDSLYELSQQDD